MGDEFRDTAAGRRVSEPETYELTIEVNWDLVGELEEALEYVRERLLGEVPEVLAELVRELSRTVWEGYARDGIPVRLVGDDGNPLGEPVELSPEEAVREAAEVESYVTWMNSAEGQAELDRAERLAALREERSVETSELYRAWLERRAQQFRRAKRDWHRARSAALERELDTGVTLATSDHADG